MGKTVTEIKKRLDGLRRDESGGAAVQSALMFGAIAMALSVLIAPQLKNAVDVYAENRGLGIDRVITGSVEKSKRYTIRKSVLDK
jgi:Flp pilus assembly pilin Flp